MVDELYQKALLRLAANATGAGSIDTPDVELTLDNPTCGDRVSVQLKVTDGHITEFAHDTRACMLCQAPVSMIGQYIDGLGSTELGVMRDKMQQLLKTPEAEIDADWPELASFKAVADHKSRHFCVLLPFDVLIEALGGVQS